MTLKPWLARALRRALATGAMIVVAEAALYGTLYARPELPPPEVDGVEVLAMEGSHVVTDRAAVARIVAIVRSRSAEWTRFPETVCLLGTPGAVFYQGAVPRGSVTVGSRAIVLQGRNGAATRMLSPREAAELHRLLGL
ncbi:MAG TPA: hypothetical protein VHG08_12425 [Longimicrobium sp.]|nr:hypothetical protein [Longimicrobium sp.]